MGKKFTIGIVGCGDICGYLALGVKLNPKIKIIGCADTSQDRVTFFTKKYNIDYGCLDYEDMLEDIKMDAIYLAVPHHLHYPMIKKAMEKGIHILCEKPVTCTLEEAMDLCELSQKTGVKIGINYQYRYDKGCYALARATQKGYLGDLYYGRMDLPWSRDDDYFDEGQWRIKMATAGGGTLLTQGSHLLDILLWAMDKRPVAAQGMTGNRKFKNVEVEDIAMGSLELEGGALISVTSTMVSTPEFPVTIEVHGSKGTGIYKGPESPKVKFYGTKIKKEKPPVWGLHALFRSLEAFRRWVLFDTPYLTPIEESLPVLASVLALYESAKTRKQIKIDDRYLKFLKRVN